MIRLAALLALAGCGADADPSGCQPEELPLTLGTNPQGYPLDFTAATPEGAVPVELGGHNGAWMLVIACRLADVPEGIEKLDVRAELAREDGTKTKLQHKRRAVFDAGDGYRYMSNLYMPFASRRTTIWDGQFATYSATVETDDGCYRWSATEHVQLSKTSPEVIESTAE